MVDKIRLGEQRSNARGVYHTLFLKDRNGMSETHNKHNNNNSSSVKYGRSVDTKTTVPNKLVNQTYLNIFLCFEPITCCSRVCIPFEVTLQLTHRYCSTLCSCRTTIVPSRTSDAKSDDIQNHPFS